MSDFVDEFSLNDFQRMLESGDVNFDDWINYEEFDTMTTNGNGLQGYQAPFDQAVQEAHQESHFSSEYDNAALTVDEIANQERVLELQSAARGNMDPPSISPPAAAEASKRVEDFEFTPHARILEDRRPKGKGRTYPDKQDASKKHKCDWPNCEKAFTRRADVRRHRALHEPTVIFDCAALGCCRGGNNGFTRLDKLKDHVKSGHDSDTFFRCPGKDCRTEPMKWLQLRMHMYTYHYVTYGDALSPYVKSLLPSRCPFPRCKMERFDPVSFRFHLEDHPKEDRLANSEEIWRAGYDAENCWPVCPVCQWSALGPVDYPLDLWGRAARIRLHLMRHSKEEVSRHLWDVLRIVSISRDGVPEEACCAGHIMNAG